MAISLIVVDGYYKVREAMVIHDPKSEFTSRYTVDRIFRGSNGDSSYEKLIRSAALEPVEITEMAAGDMDHANPGSIFLYGTIPELRRFSGANRILLRLQAPTGHWTYDNLEITINPMAVGYGSDYEERWNEEPLAVFLASPSTIPLNLERNERVMRDYIRWMPYKPVSPIPVA